MPLLATLTFIGTTWGILLALFAPALPAIENQLKLSAASASWVLTSFLVSATVAAPVVGRLGDIHGRRRVLLLSLLTVVAGSVISGLAQSLEWVVAGRVVQGIGAGVFPLLFGIARDAFSPAHAVRAISLISVTLGLGGGVGIVAGGLIVDSAGYDYLFWLSAVTMALCVAVTLAFVPDTGERAPGAVNWTGAVLLAVGLAAVLVAITEAPRWGAASPTTLGFLAVGGSALAGWATSDSRSRYPLVDMQTMRVRTVWATHLTAVLLGAGLFTAFVLVPQFAQNDARTGFGFGSSVTESGLLLLPLSALMLIVGSLIGRLEEPFGLRPQLISGCAVSGLGFVVLLVANTAMLGILIATALLGIGIGLGFAALANLIVTAVPADQVGVATGINAAGRTLGGAIGSACAATLLAASADDGRVTIQGFENAFVLGIALLTLALLAAMAIPSTRKSH